MVKKKSRDDKRKTLEELTNAQLLLQARAMEAIAELRPNLQADGGDLELVGIEGGIMKIKFKGACADCPMSNITLKWGIEEIIKEKLPEILRVEQIS